MRTLMGLLLLAAASSPSVEVEYDRQADFSHYQTWSWHGGVTPAANPMTDKRIREAIEKGLGAHGLSRVDKDATLFVVYHASRTTRIDLAPLDSAPPNTTGIRYAEKGSLVVDMLDAASGSIVWRGHATGVMRYGPNEIAEQVRAAVDKLLEGFPPPAGRPASGPRPDP